MTWGYKSLGTTAVRIGAEGGRTRGAGHRGRLGRGWVDARLHRTFLAKEGTGDACHASVLKYASGVIRRTSPRDSLLQLKSRVITLRDEAAQALRSGARSPGSRAIGGLLVREFVPHGYKGIARSLGRSLGGTGAANVRDHWSKAADTLLGESEVLIRRISIRSHGLPAGGNSARLLLKLNRARRASNPVTRLSVLSVVLEELSSSDLLWNHEVGAELETRRRAAEADRRAKALLRTEAAGYVRRVRDLDLYDAKAVAESLRDYPVVVGSLTGAIDRLIQGGPDVERQALLSCRSAIERLAIERIGIGDGKTAVRTLLPSETDHKPVVAVMNYLGGKIHGGAAPTRAEAEYGLKLTIATLESMAARPRPDSPGSPAAT